jgi:peptidoglycan/xylan/chitin deacetylase (PgdA/CDA1 family)
MYHEIKPFKAGKDVITPYEFESDLKYFREHGYHAVTMTQLVNYVSGVEALPENPIVLSFDDGYLNTYTYAYPLLKKYDMKIVLSSIGKDTDEFTKTPVGNIDYAHVTWDQLNEMIDSGCVEAQNHTYNLHHIGGDRVGCLQRSAGGRPRATSGSCPTTSAGCKTSC